MPEIDPKNNKSLFENAKMHVSSSKLCKLLYTVIQMKSKMITNDQELIQSLSYIQYPALKTKREITKYINWQQFTKGMRGKPNEQLFSR